MRCRTGRKEGAHKRKRHPRRLLLIKRSRGEIRYRIKKVRNRNRRICFEKGAYGSLIHLLYYKPPKEAMQRAKRIREAKKILEAWLYMRCAFQRSRLFSGLFIHLLFHAFHICPVRFEGCFRAGCCRCRKDHGYDRPFVLFFPVYCGFSFARPEEKKKAVL